MPFIPDLEPDFLLPAYRLTKEQVKEFLNRQDKFLIKIDDIKTDHTYFKKLLTEM